MAVLLEIPLDGDAIVVVEADRVNIADPLTLAAPDPGQAVARASRSLTSSFDDLQPLLRLVKEKLVAAGPDEFSVELGVKFGGETGIIIAKGTAEVNMTITLSWRRPS